MNYIKYIRGMVGHNVIIAAAASVIIINDNEEILLQRRRDDGCWGPPGGILEIDEKVEDGAKRELFEESGIVAENLSLLGIFSGLEQHRIYPNGDEISLVHISYICTNYKGNLKKQDSEVIELRFFKITEIPDNISSPDIPVINEIKKRFNDGVLTE